MKAAEQKYQYYGLFQNEIDQLERWSLDEAKAANEDWQKSGMVGRSPLDQWSVWNNLLPPLKVKYQAGDSTALFLALTHCHHFGLPLPYWCGKAISFGYGKIERAESRGWDDVFGSPLKGRRLPDLQRERDRRMPVVHDALEQIGAGLPVETTLRETAAKYAVSFELARRWYFDHCKQYPITEIICEDGRYRKRTGRPDSEFVKVKSTGKNLST